MQDVKQLRQEAHALLAQVLSCCEDEHPFCIATVGSCLMAEGLEHIKGFSPRKMRSTYDAARRYISTGSMP
jgi:hypothetical protein